MMAIVVLLDAVPDGLRGLERFGDHPNRSLGKPRALLSRSVAFRLAA